jgi:polysaccharide biosynthesis transport protein
MEEFREYLSMLRRRWEIPFWCVTICIGVALFISYTTPPTYRSTGTIMIEGAEIPEELARSTVTGAYDQHLDLVRRRVLRTENIQPVVDEYNLFPEMEESRRAVALAQSVDLEQINPITLEPLIGGSAFHIHFDHSDAETAEKVATELVELFLQDNRLARVESAEGTQQFFANQAERLARDVADVETKIALFKRENQGLLPEDIRNNQAALERAERELTSVHSDIRLATEQRNLLMVQRDAIYSDTELATLKAELAVLRQRYTDDHPSIRRLVRTISAMEAEGTGMTVEDPEYRRVSAQLDGVELELEAFREREQQLRAEIDQLSERLVMAPEVEKQLQQLERDYQMITNEYREMRQRRGEAEIASNLEEENKGVRYTQIRQPRVPSAPYSPNRLGIMLMGVMFALGGSVGLVALREGADESVRSARDVIQALEGPPIAIIPVIRNEADKWLRYRRLATHGAVWVVFVGLTLGAVVNG